jgi:hypothetical protein
MLTIVLGSPGMVLGIICVAMTAAVFDTDPSGSLRGRVPTRSDERPRRATADRSATPSGRSGVIADSALRAAALAQFLGGAVRGFVSGEVDKFLIDTGQQLMVGAVQRTHRRDPRARRRHPGDLVGQDKAVTLNLIACCGGVLGRVQGGLADRRRPAG